MAGLTVIYVDTLFLLNAIVDYLLLLCSARLAGERLSRLRFALGALLGGLYAVALFLPGFGFLGRPLCRLSAAVLMVLTAFGAVSYTHLDVYKRQVRLLPDHERPGGGDHP